MTRAVGFFLLAAVFAWALISAMGVIKYPVFGHVHPYKWPGGLAYLLFVPMMAFAWSLAFRHRLKVPKQSRVRVSKKTSADTETDNRLAKLFRDCYSDFKAVSAQVASPYTAKILRLSPDKVPEYVVKRDQLMRALNAAYVLCAVHARHSGLSSGDPLIRGLMSAYSSEIVVWKAFDALVVAGILTEAQNKEILARSEQAANGLFDETLSEIFAGNQKPFLTLCRYLEHDWSADGDLLDAKYGKIIKARSYQIVGLVFEYLSERSSSKFARVP